MNELLKLAELIAGMSTAERAAMEKEVMSATANLAWVPSLGPQTEAYFSLADELFYGGEAGGGKTDLCCGLAVTAHDKSLILRRFNDDADELARRTQQIIDTDEGYNSQKKILRWKTKRIRFGGVKDEDDKQRFKGRPNDLIAFDEISDFTEAQYRFIIGWNRSIDPDQRCRVIAAGNPPTTAEGLWVIKYWAPWLDPHYMGNKAKPGELRWFTTIGGVDREVTSSAPIWSDADRMWIKPRSRSFIRSRLSDNPDLSQTDYDSVLAAMPEKYRQAYMQGRFDVAVKDQPNQMIPTQWVLDAQARWEKLPPRGIPMCGMGVDCAAGGADSVVIASRYDSYFSEFIKIPGTDAQTGPIIAGMIIQHRRDRAHVMIDLGGGYGNSTYDHLTKQIDHEYLHGYKGAAESMARSKDQLYRFYNKRTEAYWKLREALDPAQPGGATMALPPGSTIVSDLTAPTYEVQRAPGGAGLMVQMEPKKQLVKRLGRSPDEGDAVVISWTAGPRASTHINEWRPDQRVGTLRSRRPKVITRIRGRRR